MKRRLLRHSTANFREWWLAVLATFTLYLWINSKNTRPAQARFDRVALLSYLVAALVIVVAAYLSGKGDLALIGFLTMMPWVAAVGLKIIK